MLSTQANARALPAEPQGAGQDPCASVSVGICGSHASVRCVHMCGMYASVGHACEKHRQGTGYGSAFLVSGADQV